MWLPVIEASEKTEIKAATTIVRAAVRRSFAGRVVALINGRVPATAQTIMRAIRDASEFGFRKVARWVSTWRTAW